MTFLDKLEKRFGHWAVPNVVLYVIVAQLVVYALVISGRISFVTLPLIPKAVLGGELWRLFSFLISPPNIAGGAMSALFLAFFLVYFLDDEFGTRTDLGRVLGLMSTCSAVCSLRFWRRLSGNLFHLRPPLSSFRTFSI